MSIYRIRNKKQIQVPKLLKKLYKNIMLFWTNKFENPKEINAIKKNGQVKRNSTNRKYCFKQSGQGSLF